jgi:uncharacterized protein (DUF927 family)
MKTSPNDVSNQEILQELQKMSGRTSILETTTKDVLDELQKLSVKVDSNQAEILETVQDLAEHMDEEFVKVRTEFRGEFQNEMSKLTTKDDLDKLKTTMVTKGYLDDKLADHHSDIILHTQREIQKALG